MSNENNTQGMGAHIWKYFILLTIVWTLVVVVSLAWNWFSEWEGANESASVHARSEFAKDVLFRRWNAEHGGVYVPISEKTPPNPYLEIEKREIKTQSGQRLTLINPAYMTRQVHELGRETKGVRGHMTSLNPIRPENKPEEWEKRALESFERGETEFSSIEEVDGMAHLRLMRPLVTEKGCLKCHAVQGYREGDIRGGISISVPMAPYAAIARKHLVSIVAVHAALWLFGLVAFIFITRRAARHESERNRAEETIKQQLQEKETLLREVHHRIKNNILTITSLLNLQARSAAETDVQAGLQQAVSRVKSMGLIYEKLLLTDKYRKISVKEYLEELIAAVENLFSVYSKITLNKEIADFNLDTKRLFPLGLIVNELITNSMKYGFSDKTFGSIHVVLSKRKNEISLTLQDDGKGLPANFDISKSTGFGLRLVQTLTDQLEGTLTTGKNNGAKFVVKFEI